ncbi:MAG: UPF0175 family protein [Nostoc sp.]|uniref:UPF0175 family protein n=1 Tax=Nostoc sp. TaxID=1180 RepID=UPI002FFAB8BD
MMLHLSTAKYLSLVSYKTYINPGDGIPGEGYTPTEAIRNWVDNCDKWIKQYEERQISLGKFAELLGLSIEEAKQMLGAENIELDLGISSEADLEEDAKNAQ